jgi:hypothetical protein
MQAVFCRRGDTCKSSGINIHNTRLFYKELFPIKSDKRDKKSWRVF